MNLLYGVCNAQVKWVPSETLVKAMAIVDSKPQKDKIQLEIDKNGLPLAYILRQDGYYSALTKTLIEV